MMSRSILGLSAATLVMVLSYAQGALAVDTHVAVITIKEKVIKATDCATQADDKKLKGEERKKFLEECEQAAKANNG